MIVYGHDVLIAEIDHELCFTFEPLTDPGTAPEGKLFQYDESLQRRMLGLVYGTHAAFSHFTDYRVFSDLCELPGHLQPPFSKRPLAIIINNFIHQQHARFPVCPCPGQFHPPAESVR